jgi:biotin carboxyl carrier protein
MIFHVTLGGRTMEVELKSRAPGGCVVTVDGRRAEASLSSAGHFKSLIVDGRVHDLGLWQRGRAVLAEWGGAAVAGELGTAAASPGESAGKRATGPARLTAPMPGKVVRVLVEKGQEVKAGASLVVVEAMKMENELRAPRAGRVVELPVREGQAVESGALLAIVG